MIQIKTYNKINQQERGQEKGMIDKQEIVQIYEGDNDEQMSDQIQVQFPSKQQLSESNKQLTTLRHQYPKQRNYKAYYIYSFLLLIVFVLIFYYFFNFTSTNTEYLQLVSKLSQSAEKEKDIQQTQSWIENSEKQQFKMIQVQNKFLNQIISLGKPNKQSPKLKITIIEKKEKETSYCSIVNSLINFPLNFSSTLTQLLDHSKLFKILIYSDQQSQSISKIIKQRLFNSDQLLITEENISVDSDYFFFHQYLHGCSNVAYLQTTFTINQVQSVKLTQLLSKNPILSISYTSGCQVMQRDGQISRKMDLQRLDDVNLQVINTEKLSNYLIIFDARLVHILTPLNFAYYTKYSFDQLLIYPLLAIAQSTFRLHKIEQSIHNCRMHYKNIKQLQIKKSNVNSNKSLCFVSYPSNPYQINHQQLQTYLNSIAMQKNEIKISIIVYLPYNFNIKTQSPIQFNYVRKLLQLRSSSSQVKLRITANKSLSSHAVYQSAHLYCPQKSIMISSRHNVIFKDDFAVQLLTNINEQFHYYQVNYQLNGNTVQMNQIPVYQKPYYFRQNQSIFQSYFNSIQIYKIDLMKMTLFWVLKSAQLQFYQTQSAFVTYMMECLRLRIQYINKTLLSVKQRQVTQIQQMQIKSLTKYVQYSPILNNQLQPYQYHSLSNEAYRRFAPEKIPRKVHQIWIGNSKISKIRQKLHSTIKEHNPNYDVFLWRDQNITRSNFPYTFYAVQRTLQYQKSSRRSYNALVADLIRYQILYQFGGIYIDFKMEVLKPLDSFLKYQIFFIDGGVDSSRFNAPKALGVGIIGAMLNSYYLGNTLKYLIEMEKMNYQNQNIPQITGGFVIRKAFSDEQLFNVVGLGYHLFIPKPSATQISECLKVKNFSPDQQIFDMTDSLTKRLYRVGIPCKQYSQSYIISYKPLARSWQGDKRNMN